MPLVLDRNLRNTRQIAETFSALAAIRMRLGDVDDQVDVLLESGWREEDLALLTTGSRHPEQKERQARGPEHYWDTFWDRKQVYYGHVLGFKGLERPAVILTLNEAEPAERSRERLYVGLSRARDQLVVVGDPEFVEQVAGSSVLRHLRGGSGPESEG